DVSWMSETEAYCQDVIGAVTDLPAQGERPHRAGDYAFNNIGLSSFFMLSSTMPDDLRAEKGYYVVGGCGGNIAWHTEHDLMEIADRDNLVRDIKVYLAAVMGVANAAVLPFDWRATAKEFSDTLARYDSAAGRRFDLAPASEALAGLAASLDAFYAKIEGGGADTRKANHAIKRLARILVPINFTRGPRFRHDPALPIPPLPDLALCEGLADLDDATLGFAQTQLTRGRNKVVAALREAKRIVDAATA
ncbi:MAG: peptidase M28, partial [Pseudomonadota bacterium]